MDDAGRQARPRVLVGLLAVLLAVVAATTAVQLRDRHNAGRPEALRAADVGVAGWRDSTAGRAVLAARTAAIAYFSLDHRHVAADMAAVRALGTTAFVAEYDAGARGLAQRIRREQRVLTASVPRDGVATEYLVSDRALLLVAVDVRGTAGGVPTRATDYRTRVALDLVDGRWLVSAFEEVA